MSGAMHLGLPVGPIPGFVDNRIIKGKRATGIIQSMYLLWWQMICTFWDGKCYVSFGVANVLLGIANDHKENKHIQLHVRENKTSVTYNSNIKLPPDKTWRNVFSLNSITLLWDIRKKQWEISTNKTWYRQYEPKPAK